MIFHSGWKSRPETSEFLTPTVTTGWSWHCADWLIFTVCAHCFYIQPRLGPNKCAKPRGETDQSLQSFCIIIVIRVILKTGSWLACCPNEKSLHQRRQKEMSVPIQGLQFSYCCNYEWELLSPRVSCIKSIWTTFLHLWHQDWTI